MTPLRLTTQPPRAPRAELAGLIFLPRSIDKVRATLPGGEPGEYRIEGLTQALLDRLGITLDDFTQAVHAATSDDDVAAFVHARATTQACAAWNASVVTREPRGGNRAEALTFYPWLVERPDLTLVLDVLEEDDRQAFPTGIPAGTVP